MRETSMTFEYLEPNGNDTYELGSLVKSALDRELAYLPQGDVSEQDTRYPTDATSMRAFLEVFFTRHLFQLQNSLTDYIMSADFDEIAKSGSLGFRHRFGSCSGLAGFNRCDRSYGGRYRFRCLTAVSPCSHHACVK